MPWPPGPPESSGQLPRVRRPTPGERGGFRREQRGVGREACPGGDKITEAPASNRTVPRATDIEYSVALGDDHDGGIAADRSPQVRFALRQGKQGRPLPAGPAALGSPFLAPRRPLPRLAPPDGGRLLLWRRIDFGAETGSRLLQVQQGEGQPPV